MQKQAADSPQHSASLSMNGKIPEEWEASRISGPLTKRELLTYLKKMGKLPPDAKYKAS